jgi:hypothetical protein
MAAWRGLRHTAGRWRTDHVESMGAVTAAGSGPLRAGGPGAADRSAQPRRAGEAVPLAAAAGPDAHAPGRQAAPLRLALEQLPALAARGPLACWCGAGAGTAQAGVRCRKALRALRPPLAPALRAAKSVRPSALSPSPPREGQGGGPARRLARPPRQATRRSPACQRGQRNGQGSWPGCRSGSAGLPAHC